MTINGGETNTYNNNKVGSVRGVPLAQRSGLSVVCSPVPGSVPQFCILPCLTVFFALISNMILLKNKKSWLKTSIQNKSTPAPCQRYRRLRRAENAHLHGSPWYSWDLCSFCISRLAKLTRGLLPHFAVALVSNFGGIDDGRTRVPRESEIRRRNK